MTDQSLVVLDTTGSIAAHSGFYPDSSKHRRRIETEAKAKVVASIWGQILFNSLLRKLHILPRSIWNNRMSSTV